MMQQNLMAMFALRMIVGFFGRPSTITKDVVKLKNAECKLYLHPVHTDPDHSHSEFPRYRPHMVELHRCKGAFENDNIRFRKCVPDKEEEIKVRVGKTNGEKVNISMKNHTSCKKGCALDSSICNGDYQKWNEENCRCECKYTKNIIPECPAKKIYNYDQGRQCECVCNTNVENFGKCEPGKEWDDKTCSCKCKPCPLGQVRENEIDCKCSCAKNMDS